MKILLVGGAIGMIICFMLVGAVVATFMNMGLALLLDRLVALFT